ncbi:MAG: ATP-binding cassette domain-containing protein [Hyphomicrobiales bacterium]|nr:ATP-binding cassette domain-containing protein [Hyphomicrobiales bacterium]
MPPPLLSLRDIHLTFGGTPLLEGAELSVSKGEKLCLVGRNGSGKSTLLKIAAGFIEADRGDRVVQPGTTIRYLPQEPDFSGFATAHEYVTAGLNPGDGSHRAELVLGQLGLSGQERLAHVSGGEARRVALAGVLAPDPDILLLDEPTNHLDLPTIEWLEETLTGVRAALVLISHDRRFVQDLAHAVIWLDRGVTRRFDRGFSHFETWRDDIFDQEQQERHKLDRKIAAETDWLHYGGVTARRRRNQGRLRALQDLRRQRREQRSAPGAVKMTLTQTDASGKLVAEAKEIGKGYAGRAIVNTFSLRVLRGDRIGIVGPNGAGKTTLLNMLTGQLAPDSGTVRLGANLQMVSLDQRRESLDPGWSLSDALTDGRGDTVFTGNKSVHVIRYMQNFLFSPEQARTPISALSGGERGRLMLARALAQPSNLLVLDEPTNDLDLETLDLVQEMLSDYPGTVLLVSHDRDFLDRVVTSVIAHEGDGRWIEYAGGYSDMLVQREGGASNDAPKAIRNNQRPKSSGQKGSNPSAVRIKRKLSFKEDYALKTLPGRIETLRAEIARKHAALADPGLYTRDPNAYAKLASELEKAESEAAAAEDQWLALEILREELDGA